MTPENERITAKLEKLRAADPNCLLFGVETHRYRLGSRLSAADIKSAEREYGVDLPSDYASFLSQVGNGGAGPGYGLQRFGFVRSISQIPTAMAKGPHRVVKKTRHCTMSRQDLFDVAGNKVDPFTISLFDSIKALAADGPAGPDAPRRPFSLAEPLRNADKDPRWEALNPTLGTLMLADYGCGMIAYLVLNGPFRGSIWLFDPNPASFVPFGEMAMLHCFNENTEVSDVDPSTLVTFAVWYEHWIDHALDDVGREYEEST